VGADVVDVGALAEPAELIFDVVAGVPLQQADRFVAVIAAEEVAEDLLVAMRLHGDVRLGQPLVAEAFHLLDQAGGDHFVDAGIHSPVQFFAVTDQGDEERAEASPGLARAALQLRDRYPGLLERLERPYAT